MDVSEIKTVETDVVVIGAGGAGLRAAIGASANGMKTAVLAKSLLGKAHTVMAEGGHTMPVGWNCVNSRSINSAPASYASARPSPVYSHELLVTRQQRPPPPVARITALHRRSRKRPVSR